MDKEKSIRFIDSHYNEQFRIPDGGMIRLTYGNGDMGYFICRYLDEYHAEIDGKCYHICEFAERMEKSGITYEPAETMIPKRPRSMRR